MATRTIVTCDLCKQEIKNNERTVYFSATRWIAAGPGCGGGVTDIAKFDVSEFCSDACVINAVRGLLNGA